MKSIIDFGIGIRDRNTLKKAICRKILTFELGFELKFIIRAKASIHYSILTLKAFPVVFVDIVLIKFFACFIYMLDKYFVIILEENAGLTMTIQRLTNRLEELEAQCLNDEVKGWLFLYCFLRHLMPSVIAFLF